METADIAKLPWQGNHARDQELFVHCEAYIRSLTDIDEQRRALRLMVRYGITGTDEEITAKDVHDFLNCR
jgi:hypothetical protein